MERLTGHARVAALGRKAEEMLPFLADTRVAGCLRRALDGEQARTEDIPFEIAAQPQRAWVEARCAPWRRLDGEPGGVAVFIAEVGERRRQAAFVRALEAIGHSLTSSLDLNEVLDAIVKGAIDVLSAESALVVSGDGEAPHFEVMRGAGRLSAQYVSGTSIPFDGGPISHAVLDAHPFTTPNMLTDSRVWLTQKRRRQVEIEGFKAVAAAPLVAKGRVLGALVVHYWTERTFSDEETIALSRLAEQAAIAIENARLYADATRRADRLRELAQVAQLVTESLDVDDVLRRIAAATARLLGAPVAQVWTADPAADVLRRRGSVHEPVADDAVPVTLPIAEGIAARVVKEDGPVYIADVSQDALAPSVAWATSAGLPKMLAVPVMSGQALLGVLTVHAPDDWLLADEDRALVVSLAARAAVAIQNARTYAEAVRRAGRLNDLIAVTQSISASLDTRDVIQRIVDAAAALSTGSLVALHVYDRERGMLRHAAVSGVEWRGLPEERPATIGLPGVVFERRTAVLIPNPRDFHRTLAPSWWRNRPNASYYGVPIVAGETFVGVLDYIAPDRLPTHEERETLQLLAAHAGVALRNAGLYEAERVQRQRIRALADVNRRISSALHLDELLRTIAESAENLARVRFASFWLADDHARTLTWTSGSNPQMTDSFPHPVVSYDVGGSGWIARHRRPLVVDDVFADDRILEHGWWQRWQMKSFAGFPVVAGDELVAVLFLGDTHPIQFADDTRDVLDMFIAQASVAIQNARFYRHAERRGDVAEKLARLGRELTETLDIPRIADLVTRSSAELLRVRASLLYRYEPADGTLHAMSAFGFGAESVRGLVLQPGESLSGLAIAERKLVVTGDVLADPRLQLLPATRERLRRSFYRASVSVPLLAHGRVIGVLSVGADEDHQFSADDLQALQTFADQAALALENARLYAESERERHEAEALAAAARRLATSLDPEELAGQLVDALAELFQSHASALYRVREDGVIVALAFGGRSREHRKAGEIVPHGAGVVGRAIAERRPVATRDILADPEVFLPDDMRVAITAAGNHAVLAVPLMALSQPIGALAVSDSVSRIFDAREAALLQAFADQAALALENARLYASARDSIVRLRETQAQLVQAAKMSALGQLVSGVAHELNNPLSVVIGYGQLLLTRQVPDPMRRPLELMVAQGDRMAKIVRNLLFFARQRPPERAPIDVNRVIEDTLALRLNQLTVSGILIEKQFAEMLPPISGDAQQLQQVFLNLVLNAEQAIVETGRGGRLVAVTTVTDGGAVRAQIIDDGPGIPADTLPHVFEPFFTTKEVGTGTGLGLSVSYGIVQEHGGKLTVESEPGRTVFTIELPVSAARAAPRASVVTSPSAVVKGWGRVALVVEDEAAVRDLVVTLLEETGWRVEVAAGGRAGREQIRQTRFDLVVCDMRMPEGSGEALYRDVVTADAALGRSFLFITGDTANPDAWRFLREAGVPVVAKPFTPAAFMDAVRRVVVSLTAMPSRA